MSLINQMLKDLERRKNKPSSSPDTLLTGLHKVSAYGSVTQWGKYLFISGIFLVIVFTFFILSHGRHGTTQQITPHVPIAAVAPPAVHMVAPEKTNIHLPVTPKPPETLVLGMAVNAQPMRTSLHLLMSQKVLYTLNSHRNQLVIRLEHTRLRTQLPVIDYARSPIKNLTVSTGSNGDLQLFLTLHPSATIQRLALDDKSHPELQVEIVDPHPVAVDSQQPTSAKLPIKTAIALSPLEIASQNYQKAVHFAAIGENASAIQLLQSVLEKVPGHHQARHALIVLLLQTGRNEEANNVLQSGLKLQPNYPQFVELKARMLVSQGRVAAALTLLQNAPPSITLNPDYHAFIAALYQQVGQPSMAEKKYQELLTLQPDSAVWWIGLGIAAEAQGKQSLAQEAFAKANNSEGLSPELKNFVAGRLANTTEV